MALRTYQCSMNRHQNVGQYSAHQYIDLCSAYELGLTGTNQKRCNLYAICSECTVPRATSGSGEPMMEFSVSAFHFFPSWKAGFSHFPPLCLSAWTCLVTSVVFPADMVVNLTLIDSSTAQSEVLRVGVEVLCFAKDVSFLPKFQKAGDIVRFTNLMVCLSSKLADLSVIIG